jgi:hypothetical protein
MTHEAHCCYYCGHKHPKQKPCLYLRIRSRTIYFTDLKPNLSSHETHRDTGRPNQSDKNTPMTDCRVYYAKSRVPQPTVIHLCDIHAFTITVRDFNDALDAQRVKEHHERHSDLQYWQQQADIEQGWELGTMPPSGLRIDTEEPYFSNKDLYTLGHRMWHNPDNVVKGEEANA